MHAVPVLAVPYVQLHALATQSFDDTWYPALHVPAVQMVALSDVQLAPVAAVPYAQLHVFATQSVPAM